MLDIHDGADEVGSSSTSDGSAGESTSLTSAMTMARLLLLVKENQLATAVLLFAAWQAGLFSKPGMQYKVSAPPEQQVKVT